jgi:hypothetical protein
MSHLKLLTPETPLHDACLRLAKVYSDVGATKRYPLYRWTQISNDAAVLAEHVRRRHQESDALERIAKLLARLLEFVGYGLTAGEPIKFEHEHKLFSYDLLRGCLLRQSAKHLPNAPKTESLSKWVIVKYPYACSKCGETQCHCVVTPWIFEERRENPGPYLKFPKNVEAKQKRLKKEEWQDLTLVGLFEFFHAIYRNTLYQQEPWKIAFHLSEELGEVAIELTRLQTLCVIDNDTLGDELKTIRERVQDKVNDEIGKLKASKHIKQKDRLDIQQKWQKTLRTSLNDLDAAATASQEWLSKRWGLNESDKSKARDLALRLYFADIITHKIKGELADVTSWLVAVSYAIGPDRGRTGELASGPKAVLTTLENGYKKEVEKSKSLGCIWCNQDPCSNGCLIRNSMSDELMQEVIKF